MGRVKLFKMCPFRNNFCYEKQCGVWNETTKGCGMRFIKMV